ncbi:hypothetical protein AB0M02_44345 [Actinoplanes sp. NPDC051861]|uniref:hypothetical protein n=1 Tax=Actinoplanes sp. NPDC051861 TaxID=3155170 RepID=UPI003415CF69
MHRRSWRPLLALAFAASTLTTFAQPASAADDQNTFASQARAEGLTTAEARGLQARVEAILEKDGGTQIAANRVRWANGAGDTTLPLPGEKHARNLTTARSPGTLLYGCDYGYFCTWQMQYYQGAKYSYYYCQDYATPYSFNSYENNQTRGTRAAFKGYSRNVIYWTPNGAWESHPTFSGLSTYYIRPC